jgi:hypothetical protein
MVAATRALGFVLLLALAFPRADSLHDGNSSALGTSTVGDTDTAPRRSMVGFVQDCNGFPPRQSGTLCGARGAYKRGHYLWVAATQVDAVTVVDVYRPDMPTVAGSVSDPVRLKAVVAVWAHSSGEYVVAVARGVRPTGFGHVAIVDVRPDKVWHLDTFGRYLAEPKVVAATRDCESDENGRSVGRLCGARAVAVVGDLAYVAAEMSNAVSVLTIPGFLTVKEGNNKGNDVPLSSATPSFRGSIVDARLEGAYAIAIDSQSRFATAYVASRFCKSCVVLVDVSDPEHPIVGGLLPRPDFPALVHRVPVMEEAVVVASNPAVGRLRGVEFVARTPTDEFSAFAFVTTEFDGRVSTVAAECARASVALGESVQYCAAGARRGLYDVDSPPDEGYEYRPNARPNAVGV